MVSLPLTVMTELENGPVFLADAQGLYPIVDVHRSLTPRGGEARFEV
jgi:hypothetical protein